MAEAMHKRGFSTAPQQLLPKSDLGEKRILQWVCATPPEAREKIVKCLKKEISYGIEGVREKKNTRICVIKPYKTQSRKYSK
jgi:hypothetical protein